MYICRCLSVSLSHSLALASHTTRNLCLSFSFSHDSVLPQTQAQGNPVNRVALVKEPNTSTVYFGKMCVSLSLPLSHSLSPQTRTQSNTIQSQVGFCKRAQHIDRSILGRYVCVCISLSLSRFPETHHSRRKSHFKYLDLQIYNQA